MNFTLNPRLESGSHHLATIDGCQVRLKDNATFPWILIIPEVDAKLEDLHQLDDEMFGKVTSLIRQVSLFAEQSFDCSKLNVGCIGNQVRQMHVHIVARHENDVAWPGTVWSVSKSSKKPYASEEITKIREAFTVFLENL